MRETFRFHPPFPWPELREGSWPYAALGFVVGVCLLIGFAGWIFGAPETFTRTGVVGLLGCIIVRALFVRDEFRSRTLTRVMEVFDGALAIFCAACLAGIGPWSVWSTPPSFYLALLLINWGVLLVGIGAWQAGALLYRQGAFHLFARPFLIRLAWVIGGALLLTLGFCAPASAASCMERAVAEKLVGLLDEKPVWRGLTAGGNLEELWSNPETGTWTYLGTKPDGISCIVSSGTPGELIVPAPEGEAS